MASGALEFLYRALEARLGIVVRTSDPERLRTKLYAERRLAANPDFEVLSITPSRTSPNEELWIVRKSPLPPKDSLNDPS